MNARTTIALGTAILLGGYALVVRPLEGRIADRYTLVAAARTTIDGEAAQAQAIADSERERGRLQTHLARYALEAQPFASLQRLLERATAAAARHGTTIRALDVEPSPAQRTASPLPFEEQPLRLTLRGSYAGLLATVRDLIAAPLASRIAIESLAPDDRHAAGGLVAAVHVVLLHLPERERVRAGSR